MAHFNFGALSQCSQSPGVNARFVGRNLAPVHTLCLTTSLVARVEQYHLRRSGSGGRLGKQSTAEVLPNRTTREASEPSTIVEDVSMSRLGLGSPFGLDASAIVPLSLNARALKKSMCASGRAPLATP